jgi:hypothetical protein
MLISRIQIRRLVESVLLEGFKDDQRYLIDKHPDHAANLQELPPKWIAWLSARFGENPVRNEMHPFEDSIITVVKFARLDAGLSAKYRASSKFKADVDEYMPPDTRGWRDWSDPSQSVKLTVDQMETIIGLSERKKERFKSDVSEDEMESDRVGKVGAWNLWMPTTREKSCKIAGYDPITREPKTTWCTARMAGSNLFYNYIGRPGEDMTLFYIIKDNPSQDQDWLSVGFVNGNPELSGQNGGISVDRSNVGLTPLKLKAALGSDYDEIMSVLSEKNKSLGGKHPARQKIIDAAQSLEAFGYLTQGLSREESTDLKVQVLEQPEIKPEVMQNLFAHDKNIDVRRAAAGNPSAPASILQILARDKSFSVRSFVAYNPSASAKTLQILARDKNWEVRNFVAQNLSTPAEALQILAQDGDSHIRDAVAKHPSTSAESLQLLSRDEIKHVKKNVAENPSVSDEILQLLAQDESSFVREIAISQLRLRGLNESLLRHLVRKMI